MDVDKSVDARVRPSIRLVWRCPAALALFLVYLAVCLAPHARRLARPSVYADDVPRIEQLRMLPAWTMLWRPFNEHLAPGFELVSLATWQACGRTLAAAPLALTLASLLPLAIVLGLLWVVVRRETASLTAALGAVALFALATGPSEAFWWYSASSFTWALAGILVAWLGVLRGGRPGGWVAMLGSFLAPTFSAIGLLAGPAAAVRAIGESPGERLPSWPLVFAPLAGTTGYLIMYVMILGSVPGLSGQSVALGRLDTLAASLAATARAPAAVLLPGLVGRQNEVVERLPAPAGVAIGVGLLGIVLAWAWRRSRNRGLAAAALVLIVGGYLLTFTARVSLAEPGSDWTTLRVQRYHLFPQLGAVLILAAMARPFCARLDRRPLAGLAAATALAAGLGVLNRSVVEERLRYLSFPDQGRTLAALDRLSVFCRSTGITRAQVLAALDPIHPSWMPISWYNPLGMLPELAAVPRVPDQDVRSILLSSLSLRDRSALCVGLDATPYLEPVEGGAGRVVVPRHQYGVDAAGSDGVPVARGAAAFVEYELAGRGDAESRVLILPGSVPGRTLELWWSDASGTWSEARSLRWTTPVGATPEDAWSVPLDRVPHLEPRRVTSVRILARSAGPLGLGAPSVRR